MNTFVGILLLIGLIYWLWQRGRNTELAWAFWPGLGAKVGCGIMLGGLYIYYYPGGDTFTIYHQAAEVADAARSNGLAYLQSFFTLDHWLGFYNYDGNARTEVFSRWLSLLVLLGGNYWLLSIWCSILSFAGLFFLANKVSRIFTRTGRVAAVAFLFWPSIVFWSSGLLKESLTMGAMGVALGAALSLIYGKKVYGWQFALSLLAWLFLWRIKYYVAVPLLFLVFCLLVLEWLKSRRTLWYVGALAGLLLLAYWLSLTHPYLQARYFFEALLIQYQMFDGQVEPNARLYAGQIEPTLWSLIMHSPKLVFNGLYMPLPGLPPRFHILQLLLSLENFVALLLTGAAAYTLWRRPYSNFPRAAVLAVVFCLFMAMVFALASPAYGSLVRYRVYYLPLWLYMLLVMVFTPNRLPLLKKVRNFVAAWRTP